MHQPGVNQSPGASVTQVNHSVHTLSTFLRFRTVPSRQIFWISATVALSDTFLLFSTIPFGIIFIVININITIIIIIYKIYECNCEWLSLSTSESKPWTLGGKEGFYLMERTRLRRWAVERRVIFWSSCMLRSSGLNNMVTLDGHVIVIIIII